MRGRTMRGRTRRAGGTRAKLLGQAAALGRQHDTRGRGQQGGRRRRNQVGAQQEDRAPGRSPGHLRGAGLYAYQSLQRNLQVLRV